MSDSYRKLIYFYFFFTPAGTAFSIEEQYSTVDKSVATTVQDTEQTETGKTEFLTKVTSTESISLDTFEPGISTKTLPTTGSQHTDTRLTTTQKGTTETDTQEAVDDRTTVDIIPPKVTDASFSTITETAVDKTTPDITSSRATGVPISTITEETTDITETGDPSTSKEEVATRTTEATNVTDSAIFTGTYVFFLLVSLLNRHIINLFYYANQFEFHLMSQLM